MTLVTKLEIREREMYDTPCRDTYDTVEECCNDTIGIKFLCNTYNYSVFRQKEQTFRIDTLDGYLLYVLKKKNIARNYSI